MNVGGAQVNFVEMGRGAPIVFVHGLSGCWQNWLENLPHFARSNRVIAIDLPGFGNSPMPPWEITISAYGDLLRDFCEQLDAAPVALVGNSMGGFVATEAVIGRPQIADRLVLVSAAGITFARARRQPAEMVARSAQALGPVVARFRRIGLVRPRARRLAFRGIFHSPNRLRPELLYEQVESALESPAMPAAIRALFGYDAREGLAEIEVPTLIVWGRNDRIVPVPAAYGYERRIPNARLELFEQTGHLPQLERPARFNRLLEEFLAERI